jgi:PKD repeat protein
VTPPGVGPVAQFSYAWSGTQGVGMPLVFDATQSSSLAGLVSYGWEFGDGATGSGVTVQHAFAAAGTFAVRLTVTDKKGQTAWVTQQVLVASGPTALFTWTPGEPTAGAWVSFDGTKSFAMPPAAVVSYLWDFGDGSVGSGATPLHSFVLAGTYMVRLVVTDGNGLVGRLTQTVTVK